MKKKEKEKKTQLSISLQKNNNKVFLAPSSKFHFFYLICSNIWKSSASLETLFFLLSAEFYLNKRKKKAIERERE